MDRQNEIIHDVYCLCQFNHKNPLNMSGQTVMPQSVKYNLSLHKITNFYRKVMCMLF